MEHLHTLPPHGHGILTTDSLIFLCWGRTLFQYKPIYVLKYVPRRSQEKGDTRIFNNAPYLKVRSPIYHYDEMINLLKKLDPSYIAHSEYFGRDIVIIPGPKISRVLSPIEKAHRIMSNPKDKLERKFMEYCEFFKEQINGKIEFGITASMLFGMHTASSDIDMIIYTADPYKIRERIFELIEEGVIRSNLMENKKERKIVEEAFDKKMNEEFMRWLLGEKRYYGSLVNPEIDAECHLMFLPKITKVVEQKPYEVTRATIEGTVINDKEVHFSVPEFEIEVDDDVYRIICYHRAGELVREGDRVSLSGTLMRFDSYNIIALFDPIKDNLRIHEK